MSIEYCVICDEATGNAGRGEDSLFFFSDKRDDEIGPLCAACYTDVEADEEKPIDSVG